MENQDIVAEDIDAVKTAPQHREGDDIEKKKRGRKSITGLVKKDNNAYHRDYYHLKRTTDVLCECGALVKSACMTRHLKRDIHIRRMKIINQ
jgi:hypothetical protein